MTRESIFYDNSEYMLGVYVEVSRARTTGLHIRKLFQ